MSNFPSLSQNHLLRIGLFKSQTRFRNNSHTLLFINMSLKFLLIYNSQEFLCLHLSFQLLKKKVFMYSLNRQCLQKSEKKHFSTKRYMMNCSSVSLPRSNVTTFVEIVSPRHTCQSLRLL